VSRRAQTNRADEAGFAVEGAVYGRSSSARGYDRRTKRKGPQDPRLRDDRAGKEGGSFAVSTREKGQGSQLHLDGHGHQTPPRESESRFEILAPDVMRRRRASSRDGGGDERIARGYSFPRATRFIERSLSGRVPVPMWEGSFTS
jgi:hypothetical protein